MIAVTSAAKDSIERAPVAGERPEPSRSSRTTRKKRASGAACGYQLLPVPPRP